MKLASVILVLDTLSAVALAFQAHAAKHFIIQVGVTFVPSGSLAMMIKSYNVTRVTDSCFCTEYSVGIKLSTLS